MKYGILFRFPLHIIIIIQEIKVRARPGKISSKRMNVNDDDDDGGRKKNARVNWGMRENARKNIFI